MVWEDELKVEAAVVVVVVVVVDDEVVCVAVLEEGEVVVSGEDDAVAAGDVEGTTARCDWNVAKAGLMFCTAFVAERVVDEMAKRP